MSEVFSEKRTASSFGSVLSRALKAALPRVRFEILKTLVFKGF